MTTPPATNLVVLVARPAALFGATAGGQLPGATPSLGGYVSTDVVDQSGLSDNLFDDLTGFENATGQRDYRCLFVHNTDSAVTAYGAVVYLASEVPGGAWTAIAVDNVPVTPFGATTLQSTTVSSTTIAPSAVSAFSAPTTRAAGLLLGDLGPNTVKALWVRRTAANTPSLAADGVQLRVEYDTV